uniref:Tc1-like transposase DDE domain-containing protein n=1 Tax=Ditylenchus dipsaci TaxID=166011 RepID=A0A915E0K7_9BILA
MLSHLEHLENSHPDENLIFQQDNHPKHKAKIITKWLQDNSVDVMQWPAQSPDLNPIENLWYEAERRMGGHKHKKSDELFKAVKKAWESIPKERLEKLVESMPRRCQAVIDSNGYAKCCFGAFYVQNTEDSASSTSSVYCQCNPTSSPEALVMCEHLCAVALSEPSFAEKLTKFMQTCLENTKKAEEMSKANSVETIGSNDDEVKFLPSGLPLMMGSAGVEIIRCSSTSITENYRGKEEMDDYGSRSGYSNGMHSFNSGQRLLLKRENGKYNIH